ncbi:hypothetical protein HPB50_006470 [Hyalomma asiaticum]|uniref:Uncharacterized protein n=1 Tax=Hyalomma asiaticum TaxID=266040 RepID=A0ACB7T1H2_HYAAI|nr:hypothetical protein HPB50_006470 [Hyalomma asiaticum]
MIALWKKVNTLTRKKSNGRRYQTLRQIRDIYITRVELGQAQWASTCERLGKIKGMNVLWGILRKMLRKPRDHHRSTHWSSDTAPTSMRRK